MNELIFRKDGASDGFVKQQWNCIASARDNQLRSGRDVSFTYILRPTIIQMMNGEDLSSVLDAGCGSGVLTEAIATMASHITAIDLAEKNIEIANNSESRKSNIDYMVESIEEHSVGNKRLYSLIYANMVLQDVASIDAVAAALAVVAKEKATFIATVTHPWFWPIYWNYHDESWFKYEEEFAVVAPYKVSGEMSSIGTTTHFHRPLGRYVEAFERKGFRVVSIEEPMPNEAAIEAYKIPWKFPRFLAMKFRYG